MGRPGRDVAGIGRQLRPQHYHHAPRYARRLNSITAARPADASSSMLACLRARERSRGLRDKALENFDKIEQRTVCESHGFSLQISAELKYNSPFLLWGIVGRLSKQTWHSPYSVKEMKKPATLHFP
jgi:hypothetical protein